jgi:DNA (cytosine-5)-methyltransferase 1
MMKVGSLFTGIGGIDLGLERAGFEIAWQCELDSWCRQLLHQHWPSVPQYEDVTELRGGQLEPVEMLAGGFPCQDVSVAGRQAGLKEGTRSGLWSEYARLIGEIRPRYVLVENVPGLLVRGMDRVLGDLSSLGYDAEWRTISAADVGAPHLRKRIWIVAYPSPCGLQRGNEPVEDYRGESRQWQGEPTGGHAGARTVANSAEQRLQGGSTGRQNVSGVADQSERCSETRVGDSVRGGCSGLDGRGPGTEPQNGCAQLPNADLSGLEGPRQGTLPRRQVAVGHCGSVGSVFGATKQPERSEWWVLEPNVGRVAHGVPSRVDRLKGLGNAVVPQIVEHIGHLIQSHSPHG